MNKMNVAEAFEKMLEGISQDVLEEEVLLLTEKLDALENTDSISESDLYRAAEQRANEIQRAYDLPQTHITMPLPSYGVAAPKRKPNFILIAIIAGAIVVAIICGIVLFFHFTNASGDTVEDNLVSETAEEGKPNQEQQESNAITATPTSTPAPTATPASTDALSDEVNDKSTGNDQTVEDTAADGDQAAENDNQPSESEIDSPSPDERETGTEGDVGSTVGNIDNAAPISDDTNDNTIAEDDSENDALYGE